MTRNSPFTLIFFGLALCILHTQTFNLEVTDNSCRFLKQKSIKEYMLLDAERSRQRHRNREPGKCFGVSPGAVVSLRFDEWVNSMGIEREGLVLRDFSGLRGVQATEGFPSGSVVLRVPEHLCLSDSAELFAQTPIGKAAPQAQWDDLFWLSKIAVILAYERRKKETHRFQAWLRNLPVEPPPVPFDWTDEEISELQDATLEAEIDGAFFWFGSKYDEVFFIAKDHGLKGADILTRQEFLDAAYMVQSRTFLLDVKGTKRRFMVPFMDMFNHKPGCQSFFRYNEELEKIELQLDYQVEKGEQVFINYGENGNGHFLKYYGFVPINNVFETIQFQGICDPEDIQHMKNEDFPQEKMTLLENLAMKNEQFKITIHSIQPEYLMALRLLFFTKHDFETILTQKWENALEQRSVLSPPFRLNEKAVAEALVRRCERLLRSAPTTISTDEHIFHDSVNLHLQLALSYRIERKTLLKSLISKLYLFLEENMSLENPLSLELFFESTCL